MGSDLLRIACSPRWANFNPRSPHGERPLKEPLRLSESVISIHAPRMGSDSGSKLTRDHRRISIHAPRMGSDLDTRCHFVIRAQFQSTLPAWGATPAWRRLHSVREKFQSTLPAWGATTYSPLESIAGIISIHAPRMGSDPSLRIISSRSCVFQSTLPAWGATVQSKHTAMTA